MKEFSSEDVRQSVDLLSQLDPSIEKVVPNPCFESIDEGFSPDFLLHFISGQQGVVIARSSNELLSEFSFASPATLNDLKSLPDRIGLLVYIVTEFEVYNPVLINAHVVTQSKTKSSFPTIGKQLIESLFASKKSVSYGTALSSLQKSGLSVVETQHLLHHYIRTHRLLFDWSKVLRKNTTLELPLYRSSLLKTYTWLPQQLNDTFRVQEIAGRALHSVEACNRFLQIRPLLSDPLSTVEDLNKQAKNARKGKSTFYNWIRTFDERGLLGLVKSQASTRKERIPSYVSSIITSNVNWFLLHHKNERFTIKQLQKKIQNEVDNHSGSTTRIKVKYSTLAEKVRKRRYELRQVSDESSVSSPLEQIWVFERISPLPIMDPSLSTVLGPTTLLVAFDILTTQVVGFSFWFTHHSQVSTQALLSEVIYRVKHFQPISKVKLILDHSKQRHITNESCVNQFVEFAEPSEFFLTNRQQMEVFFDTINARASKIGHIGIRQAYKWIENLVKQHNRTQDPSYETSVTESPFFARNPSQSTIECLPTISKKHTLHWYGILWNRQMYNSTIDGTTPHPTLAEIRLRNKGRKKKILFKYNPYDIRVIWVLNKKSNTYFPVYLNDSPFERFIKDHHGTTMTLWDVPVVKRLTGN